MEDDEAENLRMIAKKKLFYVDVKVKFYCKFRVH